MLSRMQTFLSVAFCTACLLLSQGASREANAAAPGLKGGAKTAEIEELHKAKGLLEKADHDYDGHRARAVEDIDKAIHALHHKAGKAGKGEEKKGEEKKEEKKGEERKAGEKKEPQKKSDAQLHEAIKILEEVEKQLHEKHAKGAGEHHGKAAEDVKRAIVQLHDALKIR